MSNKYDISKLTGSVDKLTKGMNVNSVKLPDIRIPINDSMKDIQRSMDELRKSENEVRRKKEQYEKDILETLKKIEGNTANLTTLVDLIQTSNETQGEVLEIINELLALAKETDPEVVNSKYRKIMNRITTFTKDASAVNTLIGFGNTIYNIINSRA